MGDRETRNFEKGAMLSRRDVAYCLRAWLDQLESGKLNIELSDTGVRELTKCVKRVLSHVRVNPLPDLRAPEAYMLDVFDDCIQLGVLRYDDDCRFDERGCLVDGEYEYKLIDRVAVPFLSVEDWGIANGVRPGTVRQWVSRGRLPAKKEGRDLRISAIRYKPDALYAVNRNLRFKRPGELPEDVTKRYPCLAGDILDIVFAASREGVCKVIVISNESGEAKVQSMDIREDERDAMVKALRDYDVRSVDEQHYHSPVDEPWAAGWKRLARVDVAADEVNAGMKQVVQGVCESRNAHVGRIPLFTLSMEGVCSVSGSLMRSGSPEEMLLQAIFGPMEAIDARNRLGCDEGIRFSDGYPWDRNILYINSVEAQNASSEDIHVFLKMLSRSASHAFAFDPGLVVFSLTKGSDDVMDAIAAAGYRENVEPEKREEEDCDVPRVFYGYVQEGLPRSGSAFFGD